MDEFRVSLVRASGSNVLAVAGDFDLAGAPRFHAARDQVLADDGAVIVDLTDCGFIDSTGISCVIQTFQLAGEAGRPFALVGSALRMKVFELVGLPKLVPYYDTRNEALSALDGGSAGVGGT
jgi:anti-sigma B factor antagonist